MKLKLLLILSLMVMAQSMQAQVINEACMKKATGWVEKLQLNDKGKEGRVTQEKKM